MKSWTDVIAGIEDGKGPLAKECRKLLEPEKKERTSSLLEIPKETQPREHR